MRGGEPLACLCIHYVAGEGDAPTGRPRFARALRYEHVLPTTNTFGPEAGISKDTTKSPHWIAPRIRTGDRLTPHKTIRVHEIDVRLFAKGLQYRLERVVPGIDLYDGLSPNGSTPTHAPQDEPDRKQC